LLTGCGDETTAPSETSADTLASSGPGDATETDADVGANEIAYTLAEDARVSLVVTDADGAVVRELLHGAPRVAGAHVEAWDGLDERGLPLPAGTYTWKLLANPGLVATLLARLSNYPVGDAWWKVAPGTHTGAGAVLFDDHGVYVGGAITENAPVLVKLDRDRRTMRWAVEAPEAWMGAAALARDGAGLWMLAQNGVAWLYDASTGTPWGSCNANKDGEPVSTDPAVGLDRDISAAGGMLAVAFPDRDRVVLVDQATCEIVEEITLPTPAGVVLDADGTLWVSTAQGLWTRPQGGAEQWLAAPTGLTRLDLDPADDTLWALEPATCSVLVLDPATGAQLRREGDDCRGFGDYAASRDRIGLATDVAADGVGGFAVAEPGLPPRRVAFFAQDGAFVDHLVGPQAWGEFLMPDPGAPDIVWASSASGALMRLHVDLDTGAWEVESTYDLAALAGGAWPRSPPGALMELRRIEGRTYIFLAGVGKDPAVAVHDETLGTLRAVVVGQSSARPDLLPEPLGSYITEQGWSWWLWTDGDGDGDMLTADSSIDTAEIVGAVASDGVQPYGNDSAIGLDGAIVWTAPGLADIWRTTSRG
jgi:hypothetical protein